MIDGHGGEVCAVVVTYRPDPSTLNTLLASVAGQVGGVVVVDNSSDAVARVAVDVAGYGATFLRQGRNNGLAHAQNVGLEWARGHGYKYVLLLDQDSTPGEGMVAALLNAFETLPGRVAAVGPRFHDLREDRDAPFVRVGFPLNQKLGCQRLGQAIECDFLISSGTLIPLSVIDKIGLMDAGLFIDNVDLEWSFRARAMGYSLNGICAATMHHRLGDARRSLPFGLGRVVVHGPVRLYYMMRNRVKLYRLPHTPCVWVAQDLPRALMKFFLFSLLIGPRRRNIRFMLRGIWDGIRGKFGECPLL